MPDALLTPQAVANLLILLFFANEAVRWRGQRAPHAADDRGTTAVFRGCYVIALLALNSPIPSPVMAAEQVVWLGMFASASGLGALVEATWAMRKRKRQGEDGWRGTDRRGNVVFWIGGTTASGNLFAALAVTVAMLAASWVRYSSESRSRLGTQRGPLRGAGR